MSTMIKYTIQEIIDLAPSFSLLEIVTQKECFFCFIWVFKVSEVDADPKGRFVSFKVTPSNEFSACVPSEYSTREQLARGDFLKDYKIICKIKMREVKTK